VARATFVSVILCRANEGNNVVGSFQTTAAGLAVRSEVF
jgi:hypothetical protein